MATRFYLPSSGAAAVSPAFDALWEKTNNADRIRCVTTKSSTAMTSKTSSNTNGGPADEDVLSRQYVSDAISSQTITGSIKGQIRVLESNGLADYYRAISVRVCSNDGTTFRGTLFTNFGGGNEFSSSALTNRIFPASDAVASTVAQSNDRIVIEIGARKKTSEASTRTATHSLGDDNATDLTDANQTETNPLNPWIELSFNIAFAGGGGPVIPVFMHQYKLRRL